MVIQCCTPKIGLIVTISFPFDFSPVTARSWPVASSGYPVRRSIAIAFAIPSQLLLHFSLQFPCLFPMEHHKQVAF
jgi:hypothetical protein